MISLRYHIATIVAIFLSLGVGILLGAGSGQQWLSQQEQYLLSRMEIKYEEALQSNRQLQQQLVELNQKIESANQDLITLVTNNYSPNLKGEPIAVWYGDPLDGKKVKSILSQVGMEVEDLTENKQYMQTPLLIINSQVPEWVNQIPDESWIHVPKQPSSPIDQWKLLQDVLLLVKGSD